MLFIDENKHFEKDVDEIQVVDAGLVGKMYADGCYHAVTHLTNNREA